MELDYQEHINGYDEHVIRLYNFIPEEAQQFKAIIEKLLKDKKAVELSEFDFIQARNWKLTLRLAEKDYGIETEDGEHFYCDLTWLAYTDMLRLVTPFCHKQIRQFQWLYELDTPIGFLFSPAGRNQD